MLSESGNIESENVPQCSPSNVPPSSCCPAQQCKAPAGCPGSAGTARNSASRTFDNETDPIDSALLAALRDDRERVALLRLEQVVMDFVAQQPAEEHWIEVGGTCNSTIVSSHPHLWSHRPGGGRQTSFQRCLLHRLADRFNIVRQPAQQLLDGPAIRLYKTPQTSMPRRLLQDVDASEYALLENNESGVAGTTTTSGSDNNTNSGTLSGATNGLTNSLSNMELGNMKIMKRSSGTPGKPLPERRPSHRRQDSTEKERAYAEARARIFNEGDGDGDADDSRSAVVESSSLNTPSPDNTKTANTNTPLDTPPHRSGDNTNASEFKAVYRNREQEANDPDFQRCRQHYSRMYVPPVVQHNPHLPYQQSFHQYAPGGGGPNNNNTSYYSPFNMPQHSTHGQHNGIMYPPGYAQHLPSHDYVMPQQHHMMASPSSPAVAVTAALSPSPAQTSASTAAKQSRTPPMPRTESGLTAAAPIFVPGGGGRGSGRPRVYSDDVRLQSGIFDQRPSK